MSILTLETTENEVTKSVVALIDGVKTDMVFAFDIGKPDTEIYDYVKARCVEIGYTIE